jgi:Protein of unknown function (DUF2934)
MVKGPSLLAPLRFAPLCSSEHRFNIEQFLVGFPENITRIFAGKEIHMMEGAQLRAQNLVKKIAARAFNLYEARGCQDGFDVQDWLQAEREIMLGASEDKLEVSWIEWLEDSPIDDREVSRRRAHCL